MLFAAHLGEHAFGDIVVAAPVGGALGIGELVEIMAFGFGRQALGDVVDRARVRDLVDLAAVKASRCTERRGTKSGPAGA
jgi:hypothetical protein